MEHSALSVALLRQRLVSLLKAMPAAQAGDEVSVHLARVASRRLRQALPLLGVRADADALDRADKRVRRITRALGPVRELDVTLLLLERAGRKGRRSHARHRPRSRGGERRAPEAASRDAGRDQAVEARQAAQAAGARRRADLAPGGEGQRARRSRRAGRAARRRAARRDRACRRDLPGRSPPPGARRREEAALRARDSARVDAVAIDRRN